MAKTLEELRTENPSLAEQLMAEARAAVSASGTPAAPAAPPTPSAQGSVDVDPVQAERQRLQNIDALDISDEEKAAAIFKVVNMETHNSVTKASMLKVLRWLLEFSFEIKEG